MGYVCRIDEGANGEILARDYFVYDGLGSCRALVSSNGLIVAKYDYDVYGSVRGQEGQRANSFKYVAQIGHPTDEETGLIYMRARYYDPEVGRFVSEDPGQNGINWFLYVEANPINKIDLDGEASWYNYALWKLGLIFAVAAYLVARAADTFKVPNRAQAYTYASGLATIATGFFALATIGLVNTDILTAISAILTIFQSVIMFMITAVGSKGLGPGEVVATAAALAEPAIMAAFIYGLVVLGAIVASYVYEN